jgi:hypothetical protein
MQNNYGVEMVPVNSSNVDEVGYDENSQLLYVRFKNGNSLYVYKGVPIAEYEGMMNASSKGTYLHHNIKGYPYERLE